LIVGNDDDSGTKASQPATPQLQEKFLKHTVVQADRGISVRHPANWSDSKSNGVVTLQSHDRCLAMTLSAPVPAGQAKGLRSDSIALLKRSYRRVRVGAAPDSEVGGIPTNSDTVSFSDQKGNPIRVLLSVGTGKKYAYLTEIVVRDPSCRGDLQLGQVVLSSIAYTK
jgi:hypothetical protein